MDALACRCPWWSIALLAVAVAAQPSRERVGAAVSVPALSLRASIARDAALAQIRELERKLEEIDRCIQLVLEDPPMCQMPSRRDLELAKDRLAEVRRKQAEAQRRLAEYELSRRNPHRNLQLVQPTRAGGVH